MSERIVVPPHLGPLNCPHCGGRAYLIRRAPDLGGAPWAETRTYECASCRKTTEVSATVVPASRDVRG